MEGRRGHLQFHTFSRKFGLSLAFGHARHENMANVIKLQEKVSEVTLNKLWSGWPCV